jgi:hypothetical protein
MHSTISQMTPLARAYLNAVFDYHRENSSTAEDSAISKEVFRLIRAEQYELAAVEAGKTDVTLKLWTRAVDTANI